MKFTITVDTEMLDALSQLGYFAECEIEDRLDYGEEEEESIEAINEQAGRFWEEVERAMQNAGTEGEGE